MRWRRGLPAAVLAVVAACGHSTRSDPGRVRHVRTGDVTSRVRTLGSGAQVVIVINGGPGRSLEEVTAYDRLRSADRTLVTYDQRGTGQTPAPGSGHIPLATYVSDLDAIRISTGTSRVWLVGESWGGMIAGAYTAAHPDAVAGLALVDAAPVDRDVFLAGEQSFRDRLAELQDQHLLPASIEASGCGRTSHDLAPIYSFDPRHPVKDLAGTCSEGTKDRAYGGALEPGILATVAHALSTYSGPVLITAGDHDVFGPAWPAFWHRLLPTSTVDLIPRTGHIPQVEHPEVLFPTLDRWLRRR